jgi:hypothetical protein
MLLSINWTDLNRDRSQQRNIVKIALNFLVLLEYGMS